MSLNGWYRSRAFDLNTSFVERAKRDLSASQKDQAEKRFETSFSFVTDLTRNDPSQFLMDSWFDVFIDVVLDGAARFGMSTPLDGKICCVAHNHTPPKVKRLMAQSCRANWIRRNFHSS